jgi:hypothetical protein
MAILNGEEETGVTIMKMDVGLDTGAIVTQERTPIRPEDNAATLHDRLAEIGAELLVRTIPDYTGGKFLPQPQPAEGVSHAPKIKKKTAGLIGQSPPNGFGIESVAWCHGQEPSPRWVGAKDRCSEFGRLKSCLDKGVPARSCKPRSMVS